MSLITRILNKVFININLTLREGHQIMLSRTFFKGLVVCFIHRLTYFSC